MKRSKDSSVDTNGTPKAAIAVHEGNEKPCSSSSQEKSRQSKSESALNFACVSFLGFTILQLVFALAARSDAMLADCAGE